MLVSDFAALGAGLAVLVLAGDLLVRGAVALSLRFGLSPIVVSATIVAFGTSAPELLISVQAALEGAPGIALGNVVGSNIANVWLVLGVPALIAPLAAIGADAHRNTWFMIGATTVFSALVLNGTIGLWGGLLLLAITAAMVGDALRLAFANNGAEAESIAEIEDVDPHMAPWKIAGLIVAGLVGLPFGAHLLVDGAQAIARDLGVSEAVIGVTIVAVGTSLPELATTVAAALRNQADVAIGNVVGSNIFNLTAIIGTAALFAPLGVPQEILSRDLWVMLAATALLLPYVLLNRKICRWTGVAFLAAYAAFTWAAATGLGV
ncbi:MAG: calcium/sodium antiporter [Pseudomonadota bacterium]